MPEDVSKDWFQKVSDNIKWARDNLEFGNNPLVCYLSQQAVELVLKGYIYSKRKIPPKSHQLLKLSRICKNLGLDLEKYLKELAELSEYYYESRYPNSVNQKLYKKEVAKRAYENAKEIVGEVLKT